MSQVKKIAKVQSLQYKRQSFIISNTLIGHAKFVLYVTKATVFRGTQFNEKNLAKYFKHHFLLS